VKRVRLHSIVAASLISAAAWGADTMNASNHFAWSENAGWLSFGSTASNVVIHDAGTNSYLSGCAWSEGAGWIKMGADGGGPYANTGPDNWGVNLNMSRSGTGSLSGYAWSENAGWINFGRFGMSVTIDADHGAGWFDGYAWGEAIGWIHLRGTAPLYGVQRNISNATNGVPVWWLATFGWTADYDDAALGDQDGDKSFTWAEWIAGTDPTNGSSFFQCLEISPAVFPSIGKILRWDAVADRAYSIDGSTNLPQGWFSLATNLPPSGVWTDTVHGADHLINYRLGVQKE
jgi:hypothetical protein